MKKIIPSFLTILNLICGCIAIPLAFQFQFEAVLILVCLGNFFDFLDGLTARALNAVTNFGKHLDSITDIITSGVVPGVVVCQLFKLSGNKVYDYDVLIFGYDLIFSLSPISFLAFIITIGSAIRLSKFNTSIGNDEFIGLPTPANAIFFASLPVLINSEFLVESKGIFLNNYFLIISILFSVFLMNAQFRLFSLKISFKDFKSNIYPAILILTSIPILFYFHLGGFTIIILLYLLLNIIRNLWSVF